MSSKSNEVKSSIRMLDVADASAYAMHMDRLFRASGIGDTPIFSVYSHRDRLDISKKIENVTKTWRMPVEEHGWERSWGVFVTSPDGDLRIIGEVTLMTSRLAPTQRHRVLLGIGIESGYRHAGLGQALMVRALDWAKSQSFLKWVDLGVFSHNQNARRLYEKLQFIETGRTIDAFRVEGQSIDDIQMTLDLDQYQNS